MILFDEAEHRYELVSIAGRVFGPSVTTVLKAQGIITVPPQAEADSYYREAGKAMHKAIELDQQGDLDESSIDEDTLMRVNRARRWFEMVGFKSILLEHRAYDQSTGTFGTWDAVGDSKKGLLLCDFKRAAWQPGYDVQVAGAYAYMAADVLRTSPHLITCCTVPLASDLPKAVIVKRSNMPDLRATYRAAARVYAWRQQKGIV